MATIDSLKELERDMRKETHNLIASNYLSLEDLRECIEALEKQIPKKTILVYETDYNVRHYLCPICDEWVSEGANYCYDCGQRILWEE